MAVQQPGQSFPISGYAHSITLVGEPCVSTTGAITSHSCRFNLHRIQESFGIVATVNTIAARATNTVTATKIYQNAADLSQGIFPIFFYHAPADTFEIRPSALLVILQADIETI